MRYTSLGFKFWASKVATITLSTLLCGGAIFAADTTIIGEALVPAAQPQKQHVQDHKAFETMALYSDAPDIGVKWRGGIRNNSLLYTEMYWNIGDIVVMDIMLSGVRQWNLPDSATGDTITFRDNFDALTLKSRPWVKDIGSQNQYKIAGGLKLYSMNFEWMAKHPLDSNSYIPLVHDAGMSIFATQSFNLYNNHLFNLYSSMQFSGRTGSDKTWTSLYLIPSYRYFFGKRHIASAGVEYYLMNPRSMPFKIIQAIARGNATKSDFSYLDNIDQEWLSFMFYGITLQWKHIRVDINVGNHYTFTPPFIPMIGFGYNF